MIYLKNGYMIDPASGTEGYRDILMKGDKIVRIAPWRKKSGLCRAGRRDLRIGMWILLMGR